MERSEAYLDMLASASQIQKHVADMLEAKAHEAEKTRTFICGHLHVTCYGTGEELCNQSLELHESIVEIIEGITRMELSLYKNLNVLMRQEDMESSGGVFNFSEP